jgi:tetratricopeptide (TPR) repeat protein
VEKLSSAELELSLRPLGDGGCALDLRFRDPDGAADVRPAPGDLAPVRLDLEALRAAALDPQAYGALLTGALFADPRARRLYSQARAVAAAHEGPLRLRLAVEPGPGLPPDIVWETLLDPDDGRPLALAERLLLSRYLAGDDWRPVRPRPRAALRALVVIASPSDLADYSPGGRTLAPLDVQAELARARAALGEIPVTALASGGQATLERIVAALREGHDILYLVCHGALAGDEPRLWLEDERGLCRIVAGAELADRVRELRQAPALVVLASCQSAGGPEPATADGGVLAALGPRLAAAGVPAVLAMQGDITIATVGDFMPVFFAELRRDGQIDRATAAARAAVAQRPDWWVPALFLRLRDGRIWAEAGPRVPLARRLLLGAGAAVLLAGALFSIALGSGLVEPPGRPPGPTAGPPVMASELNIAVARLGSTGNGQPTTPESDRLGQAFAAELAAGLTSPGVAVTYLPASGWPDGAEPVATIDEAQALASAINADVVVYGSIAYDRETDTTSLTPSFYLSPRKLFFDAGPQLIGAHQFGAPLAQRGRLGNSLTMERLRGDLAARTGALVSVFEGLDAFVLGEYGRAEQAFAAADESGALGDDTGRALLYVLRATAAGRAAAEQDDGAALDRAERYYGEALAISQRVGDAAATARARLGQAAVTFARGRCGTAAADVDALAASIAGYEEAARTIMPADTYRADIEAWSRFGQGRGRFCLASTYHDGGEPERSAPELQQAWDLLNSVIGAYTGAEGPARERLRYFAAEAYMVLGGVHTLRAVQAQGDPVSFGQASAAFQGAFETTADPPRRAFARLQIAFIAMLQRDCTAADTALAEAAAIEGASRQGDASPRDWQSVDQRWESLALTRARAGCEGPLPAR